MADQHELKQLYEGIEADEAEMSRYRHRLGAQLRTRPSRPSAPFWKWLWLGAPLLAGLAAFLIIGSPSPRVDLDQQSLAQLQTAIAASPDSAHLRAQAERLFSDGDELERLNANMVLCITQPDGQALEAAARGAVEDPRPEFRAFYVEYLLDHADSYQLNLERVEHALDEEHDPRCLELFGHLLKMAEPAPEPNPRA